MDGRDAAWKFAKLPKLMFEVFFLIEETPRFFIDYQDKLSLAPTAFLFVSFKNSNTYSLDIFSYSTRKSLLVLLNPQRIWLNSNEKHSAVFLKALDNSWFPPPNLFVCRIETLSFVFLFVSR